MCEFGKNVVCSNCVNFKRDWCKKIVDSPDPNLIRDCQYFSHRTNMDYLTSMNVDDFARFMIHSGAWSCLECRPSGNRLNSMIYCDHNCKKHCIEWLTSYYVSPN